MIAIGGLFDPDRQQEKSQDEYAERGLEARQAESAEGLPGRKVRRAKLHQRNLNGYWPTDRKEKDGS